MNLHAWEGHLSGDVSVWLIPLSCLVYKHAIPSGLWYAGRRLPEVGAAQARKSSGRKPSSFTWLLDMLWVHHCCSAQRSMFWSWQEKLKIIHCTHSQKWARRETEGRSCFPVLQGFFFETENISSLSKSLISGFDSTDTSCAGSCLVPQLEGWESSEQW